MNENIEGITAEQAFDSETGEVYEAPVSAELALAHEGSALMATLEQQGVEESISIFGFDPHTPEGMVRVFNAQEDGDSLNDSGLTALTLEGIIIQPGVRVDPVSGSRTACANTILMTAEGNYVSQSNGIARTAARIVSLYKKVGWPEGGITVQLKEQKLAGGRTYKKLSLAL